MTSMALQYLFLAVLSAAIVLLSLKFKKSFMGGIFVSRKVNPAAYWFIVIVFTLAFVVSIAHGLPQWLSK
jgi:uncharacterized protein YneF (UPF0154 family)